MKERPILFSGPMINAILSGRKVQTRRVLKVQPLDVLPMPKDPNSWVAHLMNDPEPHGSLFCCRYGAVSDHLWVRETWTPYADEFTRHAIDLPGPCLYRADYVDHATSLEVGGDYHWRPSIFMPRAFSRITLEIESVRVERVQSISEADAIAEGIEPLYSQETIATTVGLESYRFGQMPVPWTNYLWHGLGGNEGYSSAKDARDSYRSLWDTINGKKHPWASDPWVFVISFHVVPTAHTGSPL